MEVYVLIKYVHYLGIFGVVSSIVAEHLLIRRHILRSEITRLSVLDNVYGISAILVVGAGLLMWFLVGKPPQYYNNNWIFFVKVFLFVVIGVLSIMPTVYFFKNRRGDQTDMVEIPQHLKHIVRIELLLLLIIPLLAVLMAQGFGSF